MIDIIDKIKNQKSRKNISQKLEFIDFQIKGPFLQDSAERTDRNCQKGINIPRHKLSISQTPQGIEEFRDNGSLCLSR